ncbi:MAG: pilus assembly protein TadB [bacterium]|nr:pilus assembly protein TadB [bacterium]
MTGLALPLGLMLAIGILLTLDGFSNGSTEDRPQQSHFAIDGRRVAMATAAGSGMLLLTRWPVAAIAAGAFGWFAPQVFGGKAEREAVTGRTEAIATWAEMLRDTIGAAHGIEAAIAATAHVSPPPIRQEVALLAKRIEHEPLDHALAELADDLAHPIADLIVSALAASASHSTRELANLLSTLAGSARDEASMQLRVEATRARMRTAVRVITAVTALTALMLIVLNPTYVDVYATPVGQLVLVFIFGCWGAALWWLGNMSRFQTPDRFLVSPTHQAEARR